MKDNRIDNSKLMNKLDKKRNISELFFTTFLLFDTIETMHIFISKEIYVMKKDIDELFYYNRTCELEEEELENIERKIKQFQTQLECLI